MLSVHWAEAPHGCTPLELPRSGVAPNCTLALRIFASSGVSTATVTLTGCAVAAGSGSNAGCGGTFTMYRSRRALLANDGNTTQLPSGSGDGVSRVMKVRGECHASRPLVSTRFRAPDESKKNCVTDWP